ncbi:MAG: hypothetical protein PHI70_02540 [Proteiniphilum sp.]|nr:hypothetical protein [Proteiniphilum sp.]MDD3908446.1 hypothetical protein [Proteiniphilum sp.]MDD4415654.1 hypothetical protein [Proteiniphilum sp.]
MVAKIHHYTAFIEKQEIRDAASRVETFYDVLPLFIGKGYVNAGKVETCNDVFSAFSFLNNSGLLSSTLYLENKLTVPI